MQNLLDLRFRNLASASFQVRMQREIRETSSYRIETLWKGSERWAVLDGGLLDRDTSPPMSQVQIQQQLTLQHLMAQQMATTKTLNPNLWQNINNHTTVNNGSTIVWNNQPTVGVGTVPHNSHVYQPIFSPSTPSSVYISPGLQNVAQSILSGRETVSPKTLLNRIFRRPIPHRFDPNSGDTYKRPALRHTYLLYTPSAMEAEFDLFDCVPDMVEMLHLQAR